MGNIASNEPLIIGLTVGAAVLLILIIIISICCCCRKAERSVFKRGLRRLERKTEIQRKEMQLQQAERKSELKKKHDEIREKYGISKGSANYSNPNYQNPNENIFTVENDKVTLNIN